MNSIRIDIPLDIGLDLEAHLIKHPAATFFMRASGTSLPKVGLLDGDLLIVDRSLTPQVGSLVVVIVNGELVVERYYKNCSHELWGVVTYAIHDVRVN